MITKIETNQVIWERTMNKEGVRTLVKKEIETKTFTREDHPGNFNRFILNELDSDSDIQSYAEDNLYMVEEDDCECESSLDDFREYQLVRELEDRGYKVIKCETLADTFKLNKLKEIMELS